ncbi:hypothetical protein [Streptomyces sp. DH24]|uniref:hypothetical protein n=1 Tax=Streptomyces sp. DH24 TaxID=3040123 RepID=UPI0024432425|nr:hypothetical protein [Streptomyces sp. DH24]MDG9718788.1 hypothetical protein [Streptomyces sp. DH24]
MYEYELQQYRSADLIRRAEHQRRIHTALLARRAARRTAAQDAAGPEDHTHRSRRPRYTRAA